MNDMFRLVGPTHAVEVFGIRLVGVNAQTGGKSIVSLAFIAALLVLNCIVRRLMRWSLQHRDHERLRFWLHQGVHLATALVLIFGLASIWFDDPARLATALSLVTAGLTFALQKVVTAVAGYFVILRGKTFHVGDRIRMGGVRGDVIDLGFIQTTIMEMGEPEAVQSDEPGMWVKSRQYTGRVVTVSNSHIFDQPVYNYTRNFPYIWEEMHLPVPYGADHRRAEQILLGAAEQHAVPERELDTEALEELSRRFGDTAGTRPRVYYRLTDNWLEMTVRFVVHDHNIRDVKDAISRTILAGLEEAGISVASGTYDIVGLPPIRIQGINNVDGVAPMRASG